MSLKSPSEEGLGVVTVCDFCHSLLDQQGMVGRGVLLLNEMIDWSPLCTHQNNLREQREGEEPTEESE
jgi:hypothetical protein